MWSSLKPNSFLTSILGPVLLTKRFLQLRYLQTLNNISAEKNSTIVFPVPVDIISNMMGRYPKTSNSFEED